MRPDRLHAIISSQDIIVRPNGHGRAYEESWLDRWEAMFGRRPPEVLYKKKHFNYQGTSVHDDAAKPKSRKFRSIV